MFKSRYAEGFKDGHLQAVQHAERIYAVLREELSDLRRDRDAQLARADACVDLLLQHLGTRAITLEGMAREEKRAERNLETVKTLTSVADVDEDLPYGDPRGRYKDIREAALFSEDVAGAEG